MEEILICSKIVDAKNDINPVYFYWETTLLAFLTFQFFFKGILHFSVIGYNRLMLGS